MDTIFITDYEVYCIIGVYPWERQTTQKVLISVEATTDLAKSGKSDDLTDTLSYADIAEFIHDIATTGKFQLVEALAEAIAQKLLSSPSISMCRVRVNKPGAVRPSRECGIAIQRP